MDVAVRAALAAGVEGASGTWTGELGVLLEQAGSLTKPRDLSTSSALQGRWGKRLKAEHGLTDVRWAPERYGQRGKGLYRHEGEWLAVWRTSRGVVMVQGTLVAVRALMEVARSWAERDMAVDAARRLTVREPSERPHGTINPDGMWTYPAPGTRRHHG